MHIATDGGQNNRSSVRKCGRLSRIIHFRKVVGRGEDEPHNSDQIDMENLLRCTIRGWYNRSLEKPEVRVTRNGETGEYRAVPVTGAEHDRVAGGNSLGAALRILTGFPPRYFVRLDPSAAE